MKKIFSALVDGLALLMLFSALLLVLFGGARFAIGSGAYFEWGEINLWGLAAFLFLLPLVKNKNSVAWGMINRLIQWGQQDGRKFFIGILVFSFLTMFLAHTLRFLTFTTNQWDMGFVHNSLFFPFEGKLLSCENCRNGSYLGEHLSFTFLLIAPITALLKSSLFIFALQKILVLGVLAWIAIKGPLKDAPQLRGWWLFTVLANEGLRSGLLFDFREDILIYVFFIFAAWSIWKGSKAGLLIALIGALLSKENAFASVMMVAGTVWWATPSPWNKRERFFLSAVIVLMSLAYMVVSFKVFMPLFQGVQGQEQTALMSRFPGMGKTPAEIVKNFILHPLTFISAFGANIFSASSFRYLFLIGSVALFWGARFWPWLLPGLPGIFFNLLSNTNGQRSLAFHYDLILLPWLAVAILFGFHDIKNKPELLRKKLIWGLLLALITFGRSPLFYAIERFKEDRAQLSAGWLTQSVHLEGPIAADHFVISAFTHLPKIRYFVPEDSTEGRLPRLQHFIATNRPTNAMSEGRSPYDARIWVLRTDRPDEAWLIDELISQGAKALSPFETNKPENSLIMLEVSRSPFEIWCEKDQICQNTNEDTSK